MSGPLGHLRVDWLENLEGNHQGLVDVHHGPRVVELAAVVRGGEECYQLPATDEFVAIWNHLVSTHYDVKVELLQEALDHVLAEDVGHASVVLSPALYLGVRIGPEEVADHAVVGHVCWPRDAPYLVNVKYLWGEAPVDAEDPVVDYRAERQGVEEVNEGLPDLDVVAPLALIVEPVDPGDGRALVIAPQHEEVLRIFYFVQQEQDDRLKRLRSSIHVVAQEQIVALWGEASKVEESQKVVILAMYVPDNLHRSL
mmetsp:Transcript_17446/g.52712  ORF Transcript_17446/g.52712 Transcript_17446/m.52712 type:complete len:255 (+) Transcript_17446:35-799(+)